MAGQASALLEKIYRYPVKGLSAQLLESCQLTPGQTVPFDRAWALQDERGRFDPKAPKYLPKINFLMLMRDEKLAALKTTFDESSAALTIHHEGREVARGLLTSKEGRAVIERFIERYMGAKVRGAVRLVHGDSHSFSDVSAKCLHLINRASLLALSDAAGVELDPLRFRPNLVVDGWPAWFENDLMGKEFSIGDVRLKVFDQTVRCAATNVDPASGVRDMALPDLLRERFGNLHFGIYAKVVAGGRIFHGARVVARVG